MSNEKKGLKADFNLITILIIPIAIAINFIVGNLVLTLKFASLSGQYWNLPGGNPGWTMGRRADRALKYRNQFYCGSIFVSVCTFCGGDSNFGWYPC